MGPDGGPLVAERGIGGTGAPVRGRATAGTQLAERGIGGTGIVGVITGFGSVCVGGEEVALDTGVPVSVDSAAADPAVLRAGQLVALEAAGPDGALTARSVLVRHEVSGPVDVVAPGRLRVAGQDVVLTTTTWNAAGEAGNGARLPGVGDWVAVSGLRRPDGAIEATRIDTRLPGPVLVHGTLVQEGGRLRIGQLTITAGPGAARLVGQDVTATGLLLGPELQATALEPDRLAADPGSYFGGGVTVLLVEGFVALGGGEVRIGHAALPAGRSFAAGPGRGLASAPGRAVVSFNRTGSGRFEAVSAAGVQPGTGGPDRAFTPAPGARNGGNGFGPAPGGGFDRGGAGRSGSRDGRTDRLGTDRGNDSRTPSPGFPGTGQDGSGTGGGLGNGGPGGAGFGGAGSAGFGSGGFGSGGFDGRGRGR